MSAAGSIKGSQKAGWRFVVDLGPDPLTGKRRQALRRGFATKKEAQDELDRLRESTRKGTFVSPSKLTAREYIEKTWLPSMAGQVRPTTLDSYTRIAKNHIIGKLGGSALQAIDEAAVAAFLGQLLTDGLKPKTVRNVAGVLSKLMRDAVHLKVLARNPAAEARLPQVARQAPRAWSIEGLTKFLRHVDDDRQAALWRFLALTGCRRGEALGLRWADVDVTAGVATITNQRTIAGGKIVEGAPKTSAGARTISLDDGTVEALKRWRKQQNEDRLLMGAGWPATDLVFTHADGTGLWPQTVTRQFHDIAELLGLQQIGVHGLRHTAATWMISQGISPKVVAERLGHANVSITLSLYTHVLPAHDRSAAEALSAALDSAAAAGGPQR